MLLKTISYLARKIRETSGPTVLTVGAWADGEYLKRSGATAMGGTPTAALDITGLTAADPALGDESPIYDISAAGNRKVTLDKLGFLLTGLVGGRLTLTSGTAVTTADVTAAGTLYYAIHTHDKIALYDGTRWKMYTFTERSLALTLTSGKNYDVFLYDNAGTLTLELSAAWTNDTTRADALTTQDGVQVKSGATTRRWLGTIRASGANTTEDSAAKRFVWNAYNRVSRRMFVFETSVSWAGSGTVWRQANGAAANKVEYIVGLSLEEINAWAEFNQCHNASAVGAGAGVGIDSTTVNSADLYGGVASGSYNTVFCIYRGWPGIGYHTLNWLEFTNAAGTTFYATNGVTDYYRSGLTAEVWG